MPFTPNKGYNVPGHNTFIDSWDSPLNSNFSLIDSNFGGVLTINTNGISSYTMSTTDASNSFVVLTGIPSAPFTLITPGVGSFYTIANNIGGTSGIYAVIGASGGANVLGIPPGSNDFWCDSSNFYYKNMPITGSYLDLVTTAVPSWILGTPVKPYLLCDGSAFSSATYTALFSFLGSTTLPDARGRARFNLNQGTGRLSAGGSAMDGDTLLAAGGTQTFSQANLPNVNFNIPAGQGSHIHTGNGGAAFFGNLNVSAALQQAGNFFVGSVSIAASTLPAMIAQSGGSNQVITSPGYVGGITLIKT